MQKHKLALHIAKSKNDAITLAKKHFFHVVQTLDLCSNETLVLGWGDKLEAKLWLSLRDSTLFGYWEVTNDA